MIFLRLLHDTSCVCDAICLYAGLGRPSIDEPASPMMSRLSSGIGAGKEEARQMLRRASSRFNGLLSGYRSLSVQSDDLDRHEYGTAETC